MGVEEKKYWGDRQEELNTMRFIEVRNLAVMQYKKPDGTELLSYMEALSDRDTVKLCVLQHELLNGLILPDFLDPQVSEKQRSREATFGERVLGKMREQGDRIYAVEKELKSLKKRIPVPTAKPKKRKR